MTDFTVRTRLAHLAPTEEDGNAKLLARSFCQCFDVLLGITSDKSNDGRMYWATWRNVPDEKAQAVEELVQGSTAWDIELH